MTSELIQLLQEQIRLQQEDSKKQRRILQDQLNTQRQQTDELLKMMKLGGSQATVSTSKFMPFDSSSELWKDYLARFNTFVRANSISKDKISQVFLTNQTTEVYKLLTTFSEQHSSPKNINELSMEDIERFMQEQFDPKLFVVRERFKYWSDMNRKPGETIHELSARIRQDAALCDFQNIADPQDEAMRTRFMCCIKNEAVLKSLFKFKDDELTFTKAIQMAAEIEDAARVAKETVYGKPNTKIQEVLKINHLKNTKVKTKKDEFKTKPKYPFPIGTCPRCGEKHSAKKV